jgi:cytochrome c5
MRTSRPSNSHIVTALFATTLLASAVVAAQPAFAQADADRLPEGPNRDVVARTCSQCHPLSNLTSTAGRNRERWNSKIDDMVLYGLKITPEVRAVVLDYLAAHLPP